jgi:hypothetical protein
MVRNSGAMLARMKNAPLSTPRFSKALIESVREFSQWLHTTPREEDRLALLQDLWEVVSKDSGSGQVYPAKPQTLEEAQALYDFIWARENLPSLFVLLRLWRRHRRGVRYFSPFPKEADSD